MISLVSNGFEFKHGAHWLGPPLATPDVQIPIEVKVLVSAYTGKTLDLASYVPLDLVETRFRIHDSKMLSEALHRFQALNEFSE